MADGDIVQVSPGQPTIYRASALGGCSNALLAARLGYEPQIGSGGIPQIFSEGNLHEGDVVRRLEERGWKITDQQLEVDLRTHYNADGTERIVVRGHIDGIYEIPDLTGIASRVEIGVLEIKSMGRDGFEQFKKLMWDTPGLVQKYKWQISAYMAALNMPGLLVAKNRDNGELLFAPVPTPFYNRSEIWMRVELIEEKAAEGILLAKCDEFNRYCPYPYLHTANSAYEVLDDSELKKVAEKYSMAKTAAQMADKDVKTLRKTIVDAMEVKDPGTYVIAGVRVVKSEKGCRVYLENEEGSEFSGV